MTWETAHKGQHQNIKVTGVEECAGLKGWRSAYASRMCSSNTSTHLLKIPLALYCFINNCVHVHLTITLNLNYLVDTTVEERPREVESLLGADGPVPTQVQSINK